MVTFHQLRGKVIYDYSLFCDDLCGCGYISVVRLSDMLKIAHGKWVLEIGVQLSTLLGKSK
jgi:hypothetical protein